jgi:hypothetical protein
VREPPKTVAEQLKEIAASLITILVSLPRVFVAITILWALASGVTWNGRHYELSCTCGRGVVVGAP